MNPLYLILGISAIGPIIGSAIGVWRKPSHGFIHTMLAFAGGVMLAISLLELIPESIRLASLSWSIVGILIGTLLMFTIDTIIPHIHPKLCDQRHDKKKLQRVSSYLILGILFHNFPEGIAIATGTVSDFNLTLSIAAAIAVHNIPEGICTSAPYYFATKNRWKAFLISSATSIPIILGFLLAYYLFQNIPLQIVGLVSAITAGLMIYISGDELIPVACNKNGDHWQRSSIFALILGVIFVTILSAI